MKITDLKGTVELNNGIKMPYFGLGVFQMQEGDEVINSVKYALEIGYRHIDTAALYENEKGVGEAIRQTNIPREKIFLTTKVWNSDQGYDKTLRAFEKSLNKLGFEYIDLYLIHWPVKNKYIETWKALEKLYKEGRVKAIGISNFLIHHIEEILQSSEITPMVNQVEFHPYVVQQELLNFCKKNKIQFEAWSPLMQGQITSVKEINALAKKYNKTEAQIVLRWNLQKDVVTIPKSVHRDRIFSNSQIFDFEITEEDMRLIDGLDKNQRIGPDPDNFNF